MKLRVAEEGANHTLTTPFQVQMYLVRARTRGKEQDLGQTSPAKLQIRCIFRINLGKCFFHLEVRFYYLVHTVFRNWECVRPHGRTRVCQRLEIIQQLVRKNH